VSKIEIEILTEMDTEHYERLEDELKDFLAEKGIKASILNHATGNELTVYSMPKCPKCGNPLWSIAVEEHGRGLYFKPETGKYEFDESLVTQIYKCAECGEPIGGWKSNGDSWGFVPEVE